MPTNTTNADSVDASSARTRTPSCLKWLLNERAALLGQLQKADSRVLKGRTEKDALLRDLQVLETRMASNQQIGADIQARISALDISIAIAYPRVTPSVVPPINAWAGKYGARGGLRRFLIQTLQKGAPQSLTTLELMSAVIQTFCIQYENPSERNSLRYTITCTLRKLRDQDGLVESLHKKSRVKTSGIWRWKASTTLSDLTAKAKALSHAAAADETLEPLAGCAGPSPTGTHPA